MNTVLKRWMRPVVALLACGLLAAAGARAEDDPPGRIGRIAETRGQVWMLDPDGGDWTDAVINRPLTSGDRVATDQGGRLQLQIGSTVVRLDERTDLELRRVDDDRIELMLHSGAAILRVREPEIAPEVSLETADGRFMPRGPGMFRVDRSERGSLAAAYVGELQFDSRDSALTLRPGQRAELWLDAGDRRTHYSWVGQANDDFDRWARLDDERDWRRAEQRPVSPEMTGGEDLDRYGRWDNHPEYGTVWYPTVVQTGWAPYRYGHWVYMNRWGWTWVDDAPWGFAPFHYGRWVSWRGRWAWVPGQYVRRPVYAPAMVAWVGGSNFSVSIRLGGRPGPVVGWVPLAPREPYQPSYRYSQRYWGHVNQPYGARNEPSRPNPGQPVMYTNQGVPGGVTAVSSQVLTNRQSVANARADDDTVRRVLRDHRGVDLTPPPPPDRPVVRRDGEPVPKLPGGQPRYGSTSVNHDIIDQRATQAGGKPGMSPGADASGNPRYTAPGVVAPRSVSPVPGMPPRTSEPAVPSAPPVRPKPPIGDPLGPKSVQPMPVPRSQPQVMPPAPAERPREQAAPAAREPYSPAVREPHSPAIREPHSPAGRAEPVQPVGVPQGAAPQGARSEKEWRQEQRREREGERKREKESRQDGGRDVQRVS